MFVAVEMEAADDVLHHDYGSIDDHAEVDCTEAHQIGTDAEEGHSHEAEEHGERNDRRDNEGSADLAEEDEEDHRDEEAGLEEVVLDCLESDVDDFALVVKRDDLDTFGQLKGGETLFDFFESGE